MLKDPIPPGYLQRATFLKWLLFLAVVVVAGAAAWSLFGESFRQAMGEPAVSSEEADNPAEEALGLALKGMRLVQGEKGAELWRLKASWANMLESNGYITMEAPRLVYFMPQDDKELHVVSEKGDVNQKARIMRFIGKVHASQANSTLTGELLVYNGTARTMVFPEGGIFHGDKFSGNAALVTWRMRDQVIEGSGGVMVTIDKAPPLDDIVKGRDEPKTNGTAPVPE